MKRLAFAAGTLAAGVAALAIYVLWGSGLAATTTHAFAGRCEKVHGVVAAEDIAVDHEIGMAYLSSRDPAAAGIYAYDLTATHPVPRQILPAGSERIQTFGISLLTTSPRRLFVIDKTPGAPGVEIFEFTSSTTLKRVRRVRHPLIRYPNDLVAVGADEFYLSNTHRGAPGSVLRLLETFLRLPTGDVVAVREDSVRVAARNIAYPNGVNVSADGRTVIVASTSTAELHLYERGGDGSLSFDRSISVPGLADNIEVRPDGRLIVGVHPKAIDAARHLADPSQPAPTRIVGVSIGATAKDDGVEVLYQDPGQELPAGATGVIWRDRLLIGPVNAPHFLDCHISAD